MIKYSKINFETNQEAKRFVRECDANFEEKLTSLAQEVCSKNDIKVITLSGPTCSGKTTAAKKLISVFEKHSKRVNIISIDDFYYDKEKLLQISKEKGLSSVDYESVDTIDLPALKNFIEEIFDNRKREVHCPVFDFTKGCRTTYKTIECTDDDVFVFEGIQALYPQVFDLLDDHPFCSVYICVQSSLEVGGIVFEPNEIRFLRRIVRDYNFRASSPEFIFGLWQNVRHNEDINIFPFSSTCEYQIDSVFPCEISLLKPYLEKILNEVDPKQPCYNEAQAILKKIAPIVPLPKEYISQNSLYNEFI